MYVSKKHQLQTQRSLGNLRDTYLVGTEVNFRHIATSHLAMGKIVSAIVARFSPETQINYVAKPD